MPRMPMFPLTQPLLPGAVLPLHIFEERYRTMFKEILADDDRPPEFGVAMIERGFEVGGGEQRTGLGCIARILDMEVSPDGRYGVMSVGTERIRVLDWLPDDPYPQADIEPWPDEDGPEVPADRIDAMRSRVGRLNDFARELGEQTPPSDAEISDEPELAVYHLAALAPIGPADRHRLLAAPTLVERVDVLDAALDDVEAVLEFRRS